MKTPLIILSTLAATAIVGTIGIYAFVNSGLYDVSATTPDSSLVYWATHETMEHSVARRMGSNTVPGDLDNPQKIAEGGQNFVKNCSVCHGRPDMEPTAISQGLNPTPPNLFEATREPDAQENFQFIKHGVKMTGMPGFGKTKTDDQIWALVAVLNVIPGISAADFEKLSSSDSQP